MQSFGEWQQKQAPWKMDKAEILHYWSKISPSTPLPRIRSIPEHHKGSSYPFDGMRITGSSAFVESVLSRLKDLLQFEGGGTLLNVTYHQQIDKHTQLPIPDSYVFSVHFKRRGKQ